MPKGHEKESSKTPTQTQQEPLKDTRDASNILLILDSQVIRTNPFGANVSGENSYKRAERISAALHLITNHVPESEPIRGAIRTRGLDLMSLILDLRSGFRAPASEKGQAALAAIRELISLVRLLSISGYISIQNVNAVAEALDELGSLIIVSQRSALAEQMVISREQLMPPAAHSSIRPERFSAQKPQTDTKETSDGGSAVPRERTSVQLSSRADQIVDMLRLGGVLGIKDISSNLPQYSEKMIQRELANLIGSGRVRKIGFKRWSRYQLL